MTPASARVRLRKKPIVLRQPFEPIKYYPENASGLAINSCRTSSNSPHGRWWVAVLSNHRHATGGKAHEATP
jgi:hypothetical protein